VTLLAKRNSILKVVLSPRAPCCDMVRVYGVLIQIHATNHAPPVTPEEHPLECATSCAH